MTSLQIILAMILAEVCITKKSTSYVVAQFSYPGYSPSRRNLNSQMSMYQSAMAYPTAESLPAQGSDGPLYQSPQGYPFVQPMPAVQVNDEPVYQPQETYQPMYQPALTFSSVQPMPFVQHQTPLPYSLEPIQGNNVFQYPPEQMPALQRNDVIEYRSGFEYPTVQTKPSAQLQPNLSALGVRKQKLYRNFLLNRLLRQKGVISGEEYRRNLKLYNGIYKQIMKKMYQSAPQQNTRLYAWDNIPVKIPMSTTMLPVSSSKTPKYQKYKIKVKANKNRGQGEPMNFNQFMPENIIPVMRSVPNPDSINNGMVNLALSEPLREKITNQLKLRQPQNSVESGEYLDTLQRHHQFGNVVQTGTNNIQGELGRRIKSYEDNSRETLRNQPVGFNSPWIESSEELPNSRPSQSHILHNERKRYSTKISSTDHSGDRQSTEVVEGELLPIQVAGSGGPVYQPPGPSTSSVPQIRADMFLADQNGNIHKIPDIMVPHELINSRRPIYHSTITEKPTIPPPPPKKDTEEMSRIANSLVSKYKQYQALQKLIHAQKPMGTLASADFALNATTTTTTPNYKELLTFNLAEYVHANTPSPPPSHSPLDRVKMTLLHKAPSPDPSPVPEKKEEDEEEDKIRDLAQRIIAMKRQEVDGTTTSEPVITKESDWTPLVSSSADRRKTFRADNSNADQYVEIYNKDGLTRLNTFAEKNDTNILYVTSVPN